jgi:hypothetical protein
MRLNRIIIYVKDVQRITGRTDRYARLLMKRIRIHFRKDEHQFVSVEEFCAYTGLNTDEVSAMLD